MTTEEAFQHALRHHQQGHHAAAKAAYERCLAITPDHPHALSNLGSLCRRQGQLDTARAYLERAAALAPTDSGVLYNLANLYRAAAVPDLAIDTYRRSLACATTAPQAASRVGYASRTLHHPLNRHGR